MKQPTSRVEIRAFPKATVVRFARYSGPATAPPAGFARQVGMRQFEEVVRLGQVLQPVEAEVDPKRLGVTVEPVLVNGGPGIITHDPQGKVVSVFLDLTRFGGHGVVN